MPAATADRETYRKHAAASVAVFKDHGASSIVECWGDDVPDGKLTSVPMAVKKEPHETVVIGWIVWPSREARDAGGSTMSDERMRSDVNPGPFDARRMIFGGFEPIVEA